MSVPERWQYGHVLHFGAEPPPSLRPSGLAHKAQRYRQQQMLAGTVGWDCPVRISATEAVDRITYDDGVARVFSAQNPSMLLIVEW